MEVNVEGLNKKRLLRTIWDNAHSSEFFNQHPNVKHEEWSDSYVDGLLQKNEGKVFYVDYLFGKPLKIWFGGMTIDPSGYDRLNPHTKLERIVWFLRNIDNDDESA